MKFSYIALGAIFVIFIAVRWLGVYVDVKTGKYDGPKAEAFATITKVEKFCYLHNEADDYQSHYFECTPENEAEKRKSRLYRDGVLKNAYKFTYKYQSDPQSEFMSNAAYSLNVRTNSKLKSGLKIPIFIGLDDPTYSHPNYEKLDSL